MSLSNKLSISDVDVKGKRVLIRVSSETQRACARAGLECMAMDDSELHVA